MKIFFVELRERKLNIQIFFESMNKNVKIFRQYNKINRVYNNEHN